jgi:multidrug resistance efflux pump
MKSLKSMNKAELLAHAEELKNQLSNARAAKTRYSNKADALKTKLNETEASKAKVEVDFERINDLYQKIKVSVEKIAQYFKENMLDENGNLVSFIWYWPRWRAAIKMVHEEFKKL